MPAEGSPEHQVTFACAGSLHSTLQAGGLFGVSAQE